MVSFTGSSVADALSLSTVVPGVPSSNGISVCVSVGITVGIAVGTGVGIGVGAGVS